MPERINEAGAAIMVALAGAVMWFVRNVMTNAAEISALKQEISQRQKERAEESKTISRGFERVHERIDVLDGDIKALLKSRGDDAMRS